MFPKRVEKRQGLLRFLLDACEMENFVRLSNEILSITCPCGIVFETYDPKKKYHANSCRAICIRQKCVAKVQRRELKEKKLKRKLSF